MNTDDTDLTYEFTQGSTRDRYQNGDLTFMVKRFFRSIQIRVHPRLIIFPNPRQLFWLCHSITTSLAPISCHHDSNSSRRI